MDKTSYRKRLNDFESFDKIVFEVVPRFKTSGLSGDEWRQHIEITWWFKGVVVARTGYNSMRAALMLTPGDWIRNQEPIPSDVIEAEKSTCDQPSCANPAVGRFRIKRETARDGSWLAPEEMAYHDAYRQFCARHIRRGDCSREDCDDNYEAMDGATASDSTNVEESPSVLGAIADLRPPDGESN